MGKIQVPPNPEGTSAKLEVDLRRIESKSIDNGKKPIKINHNISMDKTQSERLYMPQAYSRLSGIGHPPANINSENDHYQN